MNATRTGFGVVALLFSSLLAGCAGEPNDAEGSSEGAIIAPPALAFVRAGSFRLTQVDPHPLLGSVFATLDIGSAGIAKVTERRLDCAVAAGVPGVPDFDCTQPIVREYHLVASAGPCGAFVYRGEVTEPHSQIEIADYRGSTCTNVIGDISVAETVGTTSTLKFGTSNEPTPAYTCPKTEWVDCMPGPQSGCSSEYVRFIEDNCPGVQIAW